QVVTPLAAAASALGARVQQPHRRAFGPPGHRGGFSCPGGTAPSGAAQHEAGVDAAEPEGVGEDDVGPELAAVVGDVVEVAVVVGRVEVEGGWDPPALDGEASDGGLDGAGG